jgi:hypothetical protein
MREASYTSLRLGLYSPIKTAMGIKKDSGFFMKFVAGGLAGALGSTVGNPFDVVKTRMMAKEGKVTPSLGGTFAELYRAQGMAGFYRGLEANVMRAVVLNGTKMACYDQIKGELVKANLAPPKGVLTDFMAAFGAGFFMTCTVAPFDKIRTRLMNQPPDAKLYTGFLDCGIKIIRAEGPGGLWAGFLPIWARFAPTTSTQLVIFGVRRRGRGAQRGRLPAPAALAAQAGTLSHAHTHARARAQMHRAAPRPPLAPLCAADDQGAL